MRKDAKNPQQHQIVSFNDFMHEHEYDGEEMIENPLKKQSIRDLFDQQVFAGSKSGEDINSGMSLAQSSLMILGNKFKNNKKAFVEQRVFNPKDNGLLTSNGIDCNAESQRSIGLIGSGAYHHYRGENNDANSFKFGAFSAFSALRASPLKESYKQSRNSSSKSHKNEIRIKEINGSEIENSLCSNNGLKLQHELFFENQKNAMKKLMHGLLTQPQKLARVQESSVEVSTGHSYIDQSIVQQNVADEEIFSKKPKLSQFKDNTNLKIEELSNSKISFLDEPTIAHRDSRWQTNQSKMYSVASSQAIPEENFQSLQGLMSEKERANLEIEKINRNKSLTPLDRQKAIRSVKSLTRTIDDLIFREKDKISDHYESQLYSQIRSVNQKQVQQPDLACSDLFGLDKSKQDSIQESGSFLKSVDLSEQDIMQAREMAADELEQRPLSKDVRSNAWKQRLTKIPENKFGFQSTSLKIDDVNGSFNSLASSQNQNGNQLKKSQILNKKQQVPRLPNFAQTLPTSISNAGYNTEKNPYHGRQSIHSEAMQDVEGKTRKKNNKFWSEEIAETEREDESQQDYTKDLHSSSLQNNKNNSIADIIMTTPSFDPGSKISAAFHDNNSQENSGILLKNFSLGAATQFGESVSLMLSPSQQSQPYHLTNASNPIIAYNMNNQLEQKLINMQQHLLKYNQVLQDMETMLTVKQQLELEIKVKNDKIALFDTNLKQADQIRVQHQVKEVELIQQNTKLLTENQLLKQQLQLLENNTQDLDHDQTQEVEELNQHYMHQLELQGRVLQDYSQQVEIYKVAQAQSEQILMHLEKESQYRIKDAESKVLDYANKIKYVESLLDQQQNQQTNEANIRISGLEERIKEMQRQAAYQQNQNNQLQTQVTTLQTEKEQMTSRLDKTLQMTQKDRVQQTVTQMDLESYISQIQRLKKSEEQLKTKFKSQQISQNSQTKDVAQINSKYAIELEKNRALEAQVDELQNQLAQSINEASQTKQTLKDSNTSLSKMKIGEKEKDDQLRDLKESIRIKMSVADDLQGLLKQSRAQVEDYRMSQKEVLSDRDNIMNQLWQSQHEAKDLSTKNEMLVHELESIIDESGIQSNQNPFLTRIRSVLTTSTAHGKYKRIESIQRNTFESCESSVGDAELERAMNFKAQQTTREELQAQRTSREDDQMVPERDSSKTEFSDTNEQYFNQWVNTLK